MNILLEIETSDVATSSDEFISEQIADYYDNENTMNGWSAYYPLIREWRRISSYEPGTFTVHVSRNYSQPVSDGRRIELYRTFTPTQIDRAIATAAIECYPYIYQYVIDMSLTTVNNQFEYVVPSTIRDMTGMYGGRVEWQYDTTNDTYPFKDVVNYGVRDSRSTGGNLVVVLAPPLPPAGRVLRLSGISYYDLTGAVDNTAIRLHEDTIRILVYKACEILWRQAPAADSRDREFYVQQATTYNRLYEMHRDQWGMKMMPADLIAAGQNVPVSIPFGRFSGVFGDTP